MEEEPTQGYYGRRLTFDHRADDPEEMKRVQAAGGFITRGRCDCDCMQCLWMLLCIEVYKALTKSMQYYYYYFFFRVYVLFILIIFNHVFELSHNLLQDLGYSGGIEELR